MSDPPKTVPAQIEEAYYVPNRDEDGWPKPAGTHLIIFHNGDLEVATLSGARVRLKTLTADEQERIKRWPDGTVQVLAHLLAMAVLEDPERLRF